MHNLNEIIYLITKLRKDLSRDIHQAAEELGEISKAYRMLRQEPSKTEQNIENLREEACDLLICSLAIYYGASPDTFDIDDMLITVASKLSKWQSQVKSKRS